MSKYITCTEFVPDGHYGRFTRNLRDCDLVYTDKAVKGGSMITYRPKRVNGKITYKLQEELPPALSKRVTYFPDIASAEAALNFNYTHGDTDDYIVAVIKVPKPTLNKALLNNDYGSYKDLEIMQKYPD